MRCNLLNTGLLNDLLGEGGSVETLKITGVLLHMQVQPPRSGTPSAVLK